MTTPKQIRDEAISICRGQGTGFDPAAIDERISKGLTNGDQIQIHAGTLTVRNGDVYAGDQRVPDASQAETKAKMLAMLAAKAGRRGLGTVGAKIT